MSTIAFTDTHPIAQTAALTRRAIVNLLRELPVLVPSLVFPLFFAALGSSSFSRATQLPGFPHVRSFLDFSLAATIVQGVIFGSVQGGSALATDIELGFFERLLASPVSRTSIIVGRLGGAAALGAAQAMVFTLILLPFGVRIAGGPAAFVVLGLSGAVIGVAFGGFMTAMAISTGSAEAVQGSFPLVFVSLFLSSAFFPRQTMHGWFHTVANINPVSHLVEGIRALIIDGFTAGAVARAVGIPFVIAVISVSLSLAALRRRLAAR